MYRYVYILSYTHIKATSLGEGKLRIQINCNPLKN